MARRALPIALGVAVLAAVAYLLWQGPGGRTPAPPDAAGPDPRRGPAAGAVDAGEAVHRGASGGRVERPAEEDGTEAPVLARGDATVPSFRGRLLLPDGRPAPSARVQAFGMVGWAMYVDATDLRSRPLVEWETETAQDGSFQFPEPTRDGLRFVIRARAGELPPLERSNLPAQPGRTRDLGDLQLAEGYAVSGSVGDPDGHPVSGATVVPIPEADSASFSTWFRENVPPIEGYGVESDAAGRFTLRNLPAGRLRLRAAAPGFAPGFSAPVSGAPRAQVDGVTLVLPRSEGMDGVVTAPGGAAISGALLQLTVENDERLETRSDADGRFHLDPPSSGGTLQLTAVAPGYWPVRMAVSAAQRRLPVEVALEPLPPLVGYVEDGAGNPLAGATVALFEARRTRDDFGDPASLPRSAGALSAGDGRFQLTVDLSRSSERKFQAAAWAEGYAPAFSEVLTIDERGGNYPPAQPLALTLGPGLEARGVVLTSTGMPVGGARVHLRRLYALRGGAGRRVLVAETRRPGNIYRAASSGADGSFRFGGLPEGDYRLEAYSPGFSPAESPDFPLVGQPYEAVLTLPAASSLEGQVAGDRSQLGQLRVTATSSRTDAVDALVDPSGSFRFTDLLPETYELVLREVDPGLRGAGAFSFGAGEGLARRSDVVVAAGATEFVTLELDLSERASLAGRVRINGVPAPELNLFLVPRDVGRGAEDPRMLWRTLSSRLRSVSTDFRGEYQFSALDPGDYWLVVERGDTWPRNVFDFDPQDSGPGAGPAGISRLALALAPGEHTRRDLDLLHGRIEGHVARLENGKSQSVRGGTAVLHPSASLEGVAERRVNVGRDGSFGAEMLAAGTWNLSVRSGDYVMETPVQVPPGDTLQLDLVLEKQESKEPRPIQ